MFLILGQKPQQKLEQAHQQFLSSLREEAHQG
jgi:preprotein translocase subunit YajC